MGLLLLLLALQDPPELAKARERLNHGIAKGDYGTARDAVDTILEAPRPTAAKALAAALARVREREQSLDRSLAEVHARESKLDAEVTGGDSARAGLWKDAKERKEQCQHQLLAADATRAYVVQSLLRLGAAALEPLGEELEKGTSWLARAESAELVGRIDDAEAPRLLVGRLPKEKSDLALAAVLSALAACRGAKGAGTLAIADRLEHRTWQVGRAAARALGAGGDPTSVEPLVAAIAKSEGLMRIECDAALRKLTGTELPDARGWPDWWRANREAWVAGTYQPPPPKKALPGTTRFYGLDVKSTRVAVVLDASASMRDPAGPGQTRIDVLRAELKGLLAAMPDGARVNVIFFNERISAFAPAPRALDDKCRKEAGKFIDGIFPRWRTDLFGGLERALSMAAGEDGQGLADGIDTIYLLTDGEPTYGAATATDLLVRLARRRNRTLGVQIHTISVGPEVALLQALAKDTGGESVRK